MGKGLMTECWEKQAIGFFFYIKVHREIYRRVNRGNHPWC